MHQNIEMIKLTLLKDDYLQNLDLDESKVHLISNPKRLWLDQDQVLSHLIFLERALF